MNQVFISGLPYTSNEQEVYDLFSDCGDIVLVKLPKFQDTGRLLGYGHITFKENSGVQNALKKGKITMGSRYIEIKSANGPSKTTPEIPPEDCLTIFVRNLPYELTADQIGDAFRGCGKIKNVRMVYNHQSGQFKGFAYIDFEQHISVKKALQMNGKKVHNRDVQVDFDTGAPKAGFKYADAQLNHQKKYNEEITTIQKKHIRKEKVVAKVAKIKDFAKTQKEISAKRNKELL